MKVILLTGSYPPTRCGVGAYTEQLAQALEKTGVQVSVRVEGNFSVRRALEASREDSLQERDSILHLQYPTIGFNRYLGPQAFSMRMRRVFVTLHEVIHVHPIRRLSIYPFLMSARGLIFTAEEECARAGRMWPIGNKSCTVPIGSNIHAYPQQASQQRDGVVSFGIIRPEKGIEAFLDAAARLRKLRPDIAVRLAASFDQRHRDYGLAILAQAKSLGVEVYLDQEAEEVARVLARSLVAYLPFTDGITERRSSALACFINGAVVVSTIGPDTIPALRECTIATSSSEEAVRAIVQLINDGGGSAALHAAADRYMQKRTWEDIARAHVSFYESKSGLRFAE